MQTDAYTTDRLSPSHSLRGWQSHRLTERGFVIRPRGSEPFRASLRTCASQRYEFADVSVSSHIVVSRPALSATNPKPYLLSLIHEGTARILQDGRDTVVTAGDLVLVDRSRPLRVEATALRIKSIDISATCMREIMPQVDGLTAIRVSSDTIAGSILRETIDKLFELPANAHERVADHVADAIPHILAAAFVTIPAAEHAVPRRSEAYHRQRVLEFVHLQLRDKNLSPQMIAQAIDLSTRYIHQLFVGESMTLMQRVWIERLERCRNELAIPSLAHCSIGEIAYRWGFSHPAHFSRAFAAHFGESPRMFRRNALDPQRSG